MCHTHINTSTNIESHFGAYNLKKSLYFYLTNTIGNNNDNIFVISCFTHHQRLDVTGAAVASSRFIASNIKRNNESQFSWAKFSWVRHSLMRYINEKNCSGGVGGGG